MRRTSRQRSPVKCRRHSSRSRRSSNGSSRRCAAAVDSLDANRTLRVLERRTQAQGHPILLTVPETHYLECLILEVV